MKMTHMMNKHATKEASVNETTYGISPKPCNHSRHNESHKEDKLEIVLVLPLYNGILAKVADISNTRSATGLKEHPSNMRIPKTLVGIVWVKVRIGVTMVSMVTT
jgi:cytochrome bd-type quinol oxidase subunit 1